MSYRIDDDENRIQDLTDQIDQLEVQTFSPEVVARNESTRNTGIETGDSAALNPYPMWIPIRDFGTLGNLTIDIVLNRTDSHIAKMTLNGDAIFAFSIPPGTNKMMQFILDVTIDGVGGHDITFGNTIIPASTSIDNTPNARTVIRFTTTDAGVTYYAENLTTGGGAGTLSEPIELGFNEAVTETPPTLTIIAGDVFNPTRVTLDKDIELDLVISATTSKYKSIFVIFDTLGSGFTVTWPTSVVNPPIIDDSIAQRISVILYTIDNGTLWTHATSVGSSTGGEFFGPWTANHDAGLQDLTNLGNIDFNGVAATIQGLSNLDFFQASHSINSLAGSMIFQVDTSDFLGFFAGGVPIAKFDDTTGLTIQGTHVINMGNNIINSISELQFSNLNTHTPSNENTIAFDFTDKELKYAVALTTDAHSWYADTDRLASIVRTGTDTGKLFINAIDTDVLTVSTQFLIAPSSGVDPGLNGEFRLNGTDVKVFTGGVVKNLSDIGTGGAGANTALSNLIATSINQDLLPNSAGVFNLGSAALRWGNCFFGRIVFPTNTSPIAGDVNIVRNGDDMQSNVPTGSTFNWTFQSGSTQMELSSVELRLPGVNLDMENNSITDVNQLQITGSSGDTVRGFLSGAAGVFDITANENSGLIRLFARTSGGTLNQLLTIDGNAQSTTVGFGVAALLQFGLTGNVPSIARVTNDLQINTNNALELQIAASPVMTITSTDINIFQDLDMDNNVTVDWASTQSTVGAAGSAAIVPNRPTSYIIIKVNGTEFVIPAFAQS